MRARTPERLPTVFSREETRAILAQLDGTAWLAASLLYGSGLRLMECLRLRIKDVDFDQSRIIVRDGKGQKDRATVLPAALIEPLRRQVDHVRAIHASDLRDGFGRVYLPHALAEKYPDADRQLGWQYLFPSGRRATDPRTGTVRRHHLAESALQGQGRCERARMRDGRRSPSTPVCQRNPFTPSALATRLLESGRDIRAIAGQLAPAAQGRRTAIDRRTHALLNGRSPGIRDVRRPLDYRMTPRPSGRSTRFRPGTCHQADRGDLRVPGASPTRRASPTGGSPCHTAASPVARPSRP